MIWINGKVKSVFVHLHIYVDTCNKHKITVLWNNFNMQYAPAIVTTIFACTSKFPQTHTITDIQIG